MSVVESRHEIVSLNDVLSVIVELSSRLSPILHFNVRVPPFCPFVIFGFTPLSAHFANPAPIVLYCPF